MSVGIDVSAASGRFEAVRAYLSASTVPLIAHASDVRRLRISTRAYALGRSDLHTVDATGLVGVRTRALAHDDTEPRLTVTLVHEGRADIATPARSVSLRRGDLVATASTVPQLSSYARGARKTAVMVRVARLGLPPRLLDESAGRPFDIRLAETRVLRDYLGALSSAAPDLAPDALTALEAPTLDLVRLAVAAQADARSLAADSAERTLPLRLLAHARRNLADSTLSAAALAAAHHVSERSVYAAIASQGTTLGEFLRRERLAAAARLLTSPGGRGMTISAVAQSCGFSDHAHFSREFRKAYGSTPRDWRTIGTPLEPAPGQW
ncbi:MAG TPA: helix-turn-helix domain-containing protein [Amnibacterium sp.]|jgi:AraC-like DNA-binding protein|nr:helix-turn-helix domain-containing protein [Amnibacterium sp.]